MKDFPGGVPEFILGGGTPGDGGVSPWFWSPSQHALEITHHAMGNGECIKRNRWRTVPKRVLMMAMAVNGSVMSGDWKVQQEQTKKPKGLDSWLEQKASICQSVRARGLLYVHRELRRLEVSSTTGLLVSPFRKCDRCLRLKAYPRELCSIGHKRVDHHCQYCCMCLTCENRALRFAVKPLSEGGVKRSLFKVEPRRYATYKKTRQQTKVYNAQMGVEMQYQ